MSATFHDSAAYRNNLTAHTTGNSIFTVQLPLQIQSFEVRAVSNYDLYTKLKARNFSLFTN
jgi:hypothetical protein